MTHSGRPHNTFSEALLKTAAAVKFKAGLALLCVVGLLLGVVGCAAPSAGGAPSSQPAPQVDALAQQVNALTAVVNQSTQAIAGVGETVQQIKANAATQPSLHRDTAIVQAAASVAQAATAVAAPQYAPLVTPVAGLILAGLTAYWGIKKGQSQSK